MTESKIKQYFKEVLNLDVIEIEQGFIAYKITPEGECFIGDIFVLEQYRKQGWGLKLGRAVELEAKKAGAKEISGFIEIGPNTYRLIELYNKFGCKIISANNNKIIIRKDLINE